MSIEVLRGLERLAAIFIGGVLAYMGYRLFMNIRSPKNGEGKVTLPGDISIYISRVGPGVFFALFGTVIIALSFVYPVHLSRPEAGSESGKFDYSGFNPDMPMAPVAVTAKAIDHNAQKKTLKDIESLNQIANTILVQQEKNKASNQGAKVSVVVEDPARMLDVIDSAKLAMMLSVWTGDWGDRDEFNRWASNPHRYSIPPAGITRAAAIFNGEAK
jgi:hypothetical protein